jgi:hypothetical protein
MHEDTQAHEENIDQPEDSAATSNGKPHAKPKQQPKKFDDRRPIAERGNEGLPLGLAGMSAAILVVSFILGVQSLFPVAQEDSVQVAPTPAVVAPTAPSSPATEEEDAAATSPPATQPTTPAADSTGWRMPILSSTLAILEVPEVTDTTTTHRVMLFLKLAIIIFLATGCGLVSLGFVALSVDRPIASWPTAAARMLGCTWLAALGLLIPAPTAWLQNPMHLALIALFFWIITMLFFKISARAAATLLGGTMALLAITALGSQVVTWATWN